MQEKALGGRKRIGMANWAVFVKTGMMLYAKKSVKVSAVLSARIVPIDLFAGTPGIV